MASLSEERAFIENLLSTRLNFLLVFASIVASAATAVEAPLLVRATVLTVSAVLAFMIAASVGRSQEKLDILFDLLRAEEPDHPAIRADERAKVGGGRRRWLGYYVPTICWTALAAGAIASWIAVVTIESPTLPASAEAVENAVTPTIG